MMQHTQTHRTHQSPPATRQRRSRRRQNSLSVNNSCLSLQTGEADHSNKAGSRTPPVALNNCRGRSPKRNPRRLSIAYLCNPVVEPLSSLTKDELEALQALSHLQSFTKQACSHHHHPCACLWVLSLIIHYMRIRRPSLHGQRSISNEGRIISWLPLFVCCIFFFPLSEEIHEEFAYGRYSLLLPI